MLKKSIDRCEQKDTITLCRKPLAMTLAGDLFEPPYVFGYETFERLYPKSFGDWEYKKKLVNLFEGLGNGERI